MTAKHVVKAGETLLSIASAHRFVDWKAIWEHPDNAALREKRTDPMVLAEGDEVAVPDKEPRWERVATNQRHVFQLTALDARLKLIVEDELGVPLTGAGWTLEVDGAERRKGKVQARGYLECKIKPEWREATLTVTDGKLTLTWQLQIGDLAPVDTVRGVQARLNSLGLLDGRLTGEVDEDTKKAIVAFQQRSGLPVNGAADDAQLHAALLERVLA